MPISHDKKYIFFHIPRCAGTSLQHLCGFQSEGDLHGVIGAHGKAFTLHHMTYSDLLKQRLIEKSVLETYFKFTIIRDPYERMRSDYYWQKTHDIHGEFAHLNFSGYLDLAEQVISEQRYFEKVHFDHFRPMVEYCMNNETFLVDEILILENIEKDLFKLPSSFGIRQLPWINKSEKKSQNEALDKKCMGRVYDLYKADKQLYDRLLSAR